MKKFRIIAITTTVYTILVVALIFESRNIACPLSPTCSGISPSEVLEGWIPGGLNTFVILWIALLLTTAIVWYWEKKEIRKQRKRS